MSNPEEIEIEIDWSKVPRIDLDKKLRELLDCRSNGPSCKTRKNRLKRQRLIIKKPQSVSNLALDIYNY
ncbi:hypothetical protein BDZ89DRAFT_1071525 [Hymenopellis radicata]|nr:hypothetical protein BDZ89DRAFT_1071525 [Hymenopellis radicata]